ncbi:MAG: ester cyclase [Halioglobus sp.]
MGSTTNQNNKRIVWDWWQALEGSADANLDATASSAMSDKVAFFGPDPINTLHGPSEFLNDFWRPLLHSFPDLKRQTHIFFGGHSNGRRDGDLSVDGGMWVTGTGYLTGTFKEDYLGIPATGAEVNIRWGDFYRMENGKILEVYCLLDFIDLMQQANIHVLPPSLGIDGDYPGPKSTDGIMLDAQNDLVSAYSLEHIRQFIYEGLNGFDESNLKSMGMADYFHPDLKWYGPGGIGACYSFREFEKFHQIQWLQAFPDRQVQDLTALLAEGHYSGGPGWAGVTATHSGEYKGASATGNALEINGLDWWKRDGEEYIENWVFVDMVHLFRQFGVDLFARMRDQIGKSA